MFVTAEELLAGREMTFEVEIPPQILSPSLENGNGHAADVAAKKIQLRPLTVKDVQLIAKGAKDDEVLTSVLMIQRSVVEPALKQNDIAGMHSGLVRFLVDAINRISGLSTTEDEMKEIVESPIVRAFFVLAKEFNWTPQQVREMTVGQILGYLELLNQNKQ
ncbi:MAG TPA: hypothetical protein VFY34_08985 [Pyrinomonadaceae bacterium]|nr:hypothetical protein [Pyrinomonadaceae bacterium]